DYPSAAGKSRVVVSLRDDVQGIRDVCLRSSPNLLAYANELKRMSSSEEPGWDVVGVGYDESTGLARPDAIRVEQVDLVDGPLNASGAFGSPLPYRVTFGGPSCAENPYGYTNDTAVGQLVNVAGGYYRLSWYGRPGVLGRG